MPPKYCRTLQATAYVQFYHIETQTCQED